MRIDFIIPESVMNGWIFQFSTRFASFTRPRPRNSNKSTHLLAIFMRSSPFEWVSVFYFIVANFPKWKTFQSCVRPTKCMGLILRETSKIKTIIVNHIFFLVTITIAIAISFRFIDLRRSFFLRCWFCTFISFVDIYLEFS